MKKLLARLINYMGYEIARKRSNLLEIIELPVNPSRNSMPRAIEWLQKNRFIICTILDVGASDGRWSKDCMSHYPDSNYVLFEPQCCHSIELDAFEKDYNGKVTVIKKAVGRKSGRTYFDITDPFGGSLRNSKTNNTIEVGLISLDESIKEYELKGPYLIKLDTHGFEIPILEGAKLALKECNILIIEAYNYNIEPKSILFWQLCEYLNSKGFRPVDMVDLMYREYDNSLWQMDIVFIKSSWSGFEHISYK